MKLILKSFNTVNNKARVMIFVLICLGSIIRFMNLFNTGFYFDMVATQYEWGLRAWEMGIVGFWQNYTGFYDYPQISLIYEYIIAGLLDIFGILGPQSFVAAIKLVNWLVEILLIYLISFVIPNKVRHKPLTSTISWVLASVLYILPGFWFVSGVWGQNDSLMALIAILTIFWIYTAEPKLPVKWYKNLHILSGFLLGVGIFIKQQPILILPIVILYYLYKKSWQQIGSRLLNFLPYLIIIYFSTKITWQSQFTIDFLGISWSNHTWLTIIVSVLCVISLIHSGISYYLNKSNIKATELHWIFGFTLAFNLVLQPFLWLNPYRTASVFFATANRSDLVTLGAANFWHPIKGDNNAQNPVLTIFNMEFNYTTLGQLIFIILMTFIIYKIFALNWKKLKSLNLQRIYPTQLNFIYLVIISWIMTASYFMFFTKMHSRYYHIAMAFSFVYLAIIWGSKYYKTWFAYCILASMLYFWNQLAIFGVHNQFLSWVNYLNNVFMVESFDLISILNTVLFALMFKFLYSNYKQGQSIDRMN